MAHGTNNFHKKVLLGLISSFILGSIIAISNTNPVFADYNCSDYDNRGGILYVSSAGIEYPDGIDSSVASWDAPNATLTLNNYNGPTLCFDQVTNSSPVTIMLQGINTITSDETVLQSWSDSIIIDGDDDSELNLAGNVDMGFCGLVLEGGKVNLSGDDDDEFAVRSFIVNGGEFSIEYRMKTVVFVLNDGAVKIENNGGDEEQFKTCFITAIAVFNDGTFDIDCSGGDFGMFLGLAANMNSANAVNDFLIGDAYRIDGEKAYFDIVKARYTEYSYEVELSSKYNCHFNGTDVNIRGATMPFVALAPSIRNNDFERLGVNGREEYDNWLKENAIGFGEGVEIEPEAVVDVNFDEDKEDVIEAQVFFANAAGEEGGSSEAIRDSLHIYKVAVPVPSANGSGSAKGYEAEKNQNTEGNPYTADFKLFNIISAISVSIIAEIFIIIDLRKRRDAILNEELDAIISDIDSAASKPENE